MTHQKTTQRLALVVAVAANGVIGQGGKLPWDLPEDLAWFKKVTMGKVMVMGRKTWDSIGRPLPGRDSVVVTRDPQWSAEGVFRADSIDEALALAAHLRPDADEIAIIGGAEIFAATVTRADRLYWSEVKQSPAGDTSFPPVDWPRWRETSRERGARVDFVVFDLG